MTQAAMKTASQDIVVEEVLPHVPESIWKTLTTGELIGRWLMMTPTGFEAVKGARFTFQTRPAGAWDGVIHCKVLEVTRNERLSYSWQSGDEGNPQYGSRLDTIVTWTLAKVDGGTRLRLVHSGFVTPKNDATFRNLREGWNKCLDRIGAISEEQ
jgi:uncharacterized protein YndB with AHSA1/START domain